jgi:glutathione synthase
MRFLYVMDPIHRVLPDKDTTFAFMRAAEARGHEALHCEPHELFLEDGEAWADAHPVTVHHAAPWLSFGVRQKVRLADVEAVFIRKDPPFDDAYLYATLLLEHARGKTVLVNDPRGLRDANEKIYATSFAAHMPRHIVTSNRDRIFAFVEAMGGKGVIKPLHGAGGTGVMMVVKGDPNARSIVDTVTDEGRRLAMVQEYLPAVRQGDKRILLLEGKPLGAINRVPRADDLRSNIHVGGTVEPTTVTPKEGEMIADIAPKLAADGLVFVGLDVIGQRLTEVNVTSPTGIQELSRHLGRDVAADVVAWAEEKSRALRAERG